MKDINEEIKKYDNSTVVVLEGNAKDNPFYDNRTNCTFVDDKEKRTGTKTAKFLFNKNNKE